MCNGYCLVRHVSRDQKGREHYLYALAKESGRRDVVTKLMEEGDPNDLIGMSLRSLMAIQDHGMQYATTRKLVRRISSNVFLVELKSRRTSWRVAAYIHDAVSGKTIPVLLDTFKGHGGKSAKIPKSTIGAYEKKALIAKELVERELKYGNL